MTGTETDASKLGTNWETHTDSKSKDQSHLEEHGLKADRMMEWWMTLGPLCLCSGRNWFLQMLLRPC